MSGILAILPPAWAEFPDSTVVGRMSAALRPRGADRVGVFRDARAALVTVRHDWETRGEFAGPVDVLVEDDLAVAADASLFYRDDLVRALAAKGVCPRGDTASHLILAAYRAWGRECPSQLEGDFAFVLWDAGRRSVLAARDFAGKRPLFYAHVGGTLVIASRISAIRAHTACPADLNPVALAEDAAVLTGSPTETCFRAVSRLPAGWRLETSERGPLRTSRFWTPPAFRDFGGTPFDEAEEELLALLTDAVEQRLAPAAPTALFLSGGWDSPAVFAAGMNLLRQRSEGRRLEAISVSFPPGDSAREDELISAIVDHWSTRTRWVSVADLPLCADPFGSAGARDEPFPHLFETMNRELTRVARDLGARVVLDGNGGDQLFSVATYMLSDLLRTARLATLAGEWRNCGEAGWRRFFRLAVQPLLGPTALELATRLRRGRALASVEYHREPPEWISGRFAKEHDLLDRELTHAPARGSRSWTSYEGLWYLTTPVYPRMLEYVAGFALEEGAEHRSPLYDERVVRFAASRPVLERRSGSETKRLLRHAVRGLLPEQVLVPRPYRTGMPMDYLRAGAVAMLRSAAGECLRSPLLADLGIVDVAELRTAVDAVTSGRKQGGEARLYVLLQVELWLRAQAGLPPSEKQRSNLAQAVAV